MRCNVRGMEKFGLTPEGQKALEVIAPLASGTMAVVILGIILWFLIISLLMPVFIYFQWKEARRIRQMMERIAVDVTRATTALQNMQRRQ